MRLKTIGLLLAACAITPALTTSTVHAASNPSLAHFEGRILDLRVSWEEATACSTDGANTFCFRTEAEMDAFVAKTTGINPSVRVGISVLGVNLSLLVCSPSVKVWQGASFTGTPTLAMVNHGFYNLSSYGFDNITSSYKNFGTCDSTFYDTTGGSTAYPGYTGPGASASSMSVGWDNRVGSIDID